MDEWHVLLLALVAALMLCTVQGQHCQTELCGSQVKFWIATTKNDLGEWTTETGLEHPKKKNSPGWKLQVEGDSVDCSGETFCRLVATISPLCDERNYSLQDDYKSFGKLGRYKLHNEFALWEEAKKICESEHAHLAVVDSLAEVAVMKELASEAKSSFTLVGFNDIEKHRSFVDIFGKPVLKFWAKGEPNNKDEHCGSIGKEGTLNDYPCSMKTTFICEAP